MGGRRAPRARAASTEHLRHRPRSIAPAVGHDPGPGVAELLVKTHGGLATYVGLRLQPTLRGPHDDVGEPGSQRSPRSPATSPARIALTWSRPAVLRSAVCEWPRNQLEKRVASCPRRRVEMDRGYRYRDHRRNDPRRLDHLPRARDDPFAGRPEGDRRASLGGAGEPRRDAQGGFRRPALGGRAGGQPKRRPAGGRATGNADRGVPPPSGAD